MVIENEYFTYYCEKCDKKYTNVEYKWCKFCQTNYLKENFTIWTSENKKIDNLIQEMQLNINDHEDIIFVYYGTFSRMEGWSIILGIWI